MTVYDGGVDTEPVQEVRGPPRRAAHARTVVMKQVTLSTELAQAFLGGVIAGLGTFVGVLVPTTVSNVDALKSDAISGGFVTLTFFTNSLRNWYQQQQEGE